MLLALEQVGAGKKIKGETHGKHLLQGGILEISFSKMEGEAAVQGTTRAAVRSRRGGRARKRLQPDPRRKHSEDPDCIFVTETPLESRLKGKTWSVWE